MAEQETLSLEQVENLAFTALRKAGASEVVARSMARSIAATEADGISSHGLLYVPIYCEHLTCGKVLADAEPRLERPRPGCLIADAASGFAQPAIDLGFETLIPAAREQGIAALAIRNSYNCGVLGYHTARLASAGLVGLGFTNAPASIAPLGGRKPVIGTNPFSLAVPDGEGGCALLIDQSASVIARSEVMKRAREGRAIPKGWALDADGNATEDAEAALTGSMAPSGGYKGFGVGLMTEVFAAALAGATLGKDASPFSGTAGGPPRTGQFFIAVDPEATSGGHFAERISDLTAAIAVQEGARLPGSGRKAARTRIEREGVSVPQALMERLRALTA
jgi:(2R)-3-sulfolactate dehydrogenase (NADP+)